MPENSEGVPIGDPYSDVSTEIENAAKRFKKAVEENERLALLVFIDPIRAYADAGIFLSRQARRFIANRTPGLLSSKGSLYDEVRAGKRDLPGVRYIRLSRSERPQSGKEKE